MYAFAAKPQVADFQKLAAHLKAVDAAAVHPSLWSQRLQVAAILEQMGQEPEEQTHQAAYHSLRLLVWE